MDEARHSPRVDFSPLFVALLGFFFIAIIIAIYHCFAVGWCNRRHTLARSQAHRRIPLEQEETVLSSEIENSTVQLIPVHKYRKDGGLVEGGEEGTCAVCLCEFKEGEEVRILPECLHSFHAPCIDMWLYSHANCPLCRADTTLLLQQPLQLMSESEALPVAIGELQRLPDLSV